MTDATEQLTITKDPGGWYNYGTLWTFDIEDTIPEEIKHAEEALAAHTAWLAYLKAGNVE